VYFVLVARRSPLNDSLAPGGEDSAHLRVASLNKPSSIGDRAELPHQKAAFCIHLFNAGLESRTFVSRETLWGSPSVSPGPFSHKDFFEKKPYSLLSLEGEVLVEVPFSLSF